MHGQYKVKESTYDGIRRILCARVLHPLKEFKKAGLQITTATKYRKATKPDERQVSSYPAVYGDIIFQEINVRDYDAIIFAGGNGAWEDFFPNERVHDVLKSFMDEDKIVALLCSIEIL